MVEKEISQQTNTNQTNINKWIPTLVTASFMTGSITFKKAETLKNGLEVFYPLKTYTISNGLKVISKEDFLEKKESIIYNNIIYYELNKEYIARITIYNKIYNNLNIELLKSKTPIVNPKYHLIIFALPGKQTGSGSYEYSKVISGENNVIWKSKEVSRTGNHWIDYYVLLFTRDKEEETEILYKHAGASGRVSKIVYNISFRGIKEIQV